MTANSTRSTGYYRCKVNYNIETENNLLVSNGVSAAEAEAYVEDDLFINFYRAALNATRYWRSVRPSVHLSVHQTREL